MPDPAAPPLGQSRNAADVHHALTTHPTWDRVDGRQWAGASRSEMLEVVVEALHDVLFSPAVVGDGSHDRPWNGDAMPKSIKALRAQIRG